MAEYVPIAGNLRVNPSYLDLGGLETLKRTQQAGILTTYEFRRPVLVEMLNGDDVTLVYHPQNKDAPLLIVKSRTLKDAEAAMKSAMALEIARYFTAREISPHVEEIAHIGKELSDFLN